MNKTDTRTQTPIVDYSSAEGIGVEEALVKITRAEEDARAKKESAEIEAKAMVEKARAASRESEIADNIRKEEIFKEEIKKFETEARLKASEYLESERKKNEKEVIESAQVKIPSVASRLLEEKFLSLKWFK